jgi:dihydrofolate reductase
VNLAQQKAPAIGRSMERSLKGVGMGKVIFDISMSLDGFITAANARPEAGLGDGGERLHDWGFYSADPRNREVMEWYGTTGANIFGRTGYDHSILNWGADGPTGAARVPTVIVSHSVPQDIPRDGVYSFVDGIEAALEKAKELAGDKDIYITGADVAQQFLKHGLIDEISIHLVPVLFGSGTRLFEHLDKEHISLEVIEVIQTAEAIHLRFRILK